jgi:hypothetical protein
MYGDQCNLPVLDLRTNFILPFEPLSTEWLEELHLDDDPRFHDFLRTEFELPPPDLGEYWCHHSTKEVFSPIMGAESHDGMEDVSQARHGVEDSNDMEFEVDPLPRVIQMNSNVFGEDEIRRFQELVDTGEVIGEQLESDVLLQIGSRLIAILTVNRDSPKNIEMILRKHGNFRVILVVSCFPPKFFGGTRIRWRCITSHHQIAPALFPFLDLSAG